MECNCFRWHDEYTVRTFSPLERGRTRKLCDNFEKGSTSNSTSSWARKKQTEGTSPIVASRLGGEDIATHPCSDTPLQNDRPPTGPPNAQPNGRHKTMAEMVREQAKANGPQPFEPEKIDNIGFASLNDGIPSIYLSRAETKKIADSMEHAIVGKFSHSIPASHQIQKALDNIKLTQGFSWNQCETHFDPT